MKNALWIFFVFLMMFFTAPLLLIMIALVRTEIPLGLAALYWLPISIAASLALTCFYTRKMRKPLIEKNG